MAANAANPNNANPPALHFQPIGAANPALHVEPLDDICISIRTPAGRIINLDISSDALKQEHQELHNALTEEYPDATINIKKGLLELNGRPVKNLHADPVDAENLKKLQALYNKILGQKHNPVSWHSFKPGNRVHTNAPAPFRQPPEFKPIKSYSFDKPQLAKLTKEKPVNQANEIHKRYLVREALLQNLDTLLNHTKQAALNTRSLDGQSRAQQLEATREELKNLDSLVLTFAALHPLDLPPNLPADQMIRHLDAQKQNAMTFLESTQPSKLKFWKGKHPDLINSLANQLAMISCQTRDQYDAALIHFNEQPKSTSSELFLIPLFTLAAAGNRQGVQQHIEDHFDLAFPHILKAEDRDTVKAGLLRLADAQAQRVWPNPVTI